MNEMIALIFTVLLGIISILTTIILVAWKLRGYFAKIEIEMSAFKEVMHGINRRIERLESKIP